MSSLILSFLIVITLASNANAPILYNIGKPPPPKRPPPRTLTFILTSSPGEESEESSALMFRSLSTLFTSFAAIEQGNIRKAEALMETVRSDLRKAVVFYEELASNTSDRPISMGNMNHDEIRIIKKDFEQYRLELPKNDRELASIAHDEVKSFSEFLNKVVFRDHFAKNRKTIRDIVNRLNRYMRVGISLSEIDASNI